MEYCCKSIKYHLDPSNNLSDENDSPDIIIKYIAKFDEYGIPIYDGGSSMIVIHYCPWCGKQLPESKRDLWFDTLENMEVNVDLADEIPEEFRSSKWYINK